MRSGDEQHYKLLYRVHLKWYEKIWYAITFQWDKFKYK